QLEVDRGVVDLGPGLRQMRLELAIGEIVNDELVEHHVADEGDLRSCVEIIIEAADRLGLRDAHHPFRLLRPGRQRRQGKGRQAGQQRGQLQQSHKIILLIGYEAVAPSGLSSWASKAPDCAARLPRGLPSSRSRAWGLPVVNRGSGRRADAVTKAAG